MVAGGFALIAASGAAQAAVGAAAPIFSTSVVGGAAGLLGIYTKWNSAEKRIVLPLHWFHIIWSILINQKVISRVLHVT